MDKKIKCPGCGMELKADTLKCPRCGKIINCSTCCSGNCLKCSLNRQN